MTKPWRIALFLLAACGTQHQNAAPDAPDPIDAPSIDAPAAFTEAPHGEAPQATSSGGPVLAQPKIVPIFFSNDGMIQGQVEQFLSMLGASPYWSATTSEYGVGTIASETTIVTTATVPTTDTALESWLSSQLDGTHAGWTYDPNTIYAVFLPPGAVLQTQFGQSCQSFGAYHSEIMGTQGHRIIYALMPRCGSLRSLTTATSHELIEAVTDPFPFSEGAYQNVDDDHVAFELAGGGELGDLCEFLPDASQQLVGGFYVQRSWSNASVKAGHDPCVPALDTPYTGAAPILNDSVTLDFGDQGGQFTTKGVEIPLHMSKTIDVALFSDAATADFQVHALDLAGDLSGGSPELSFQWDKATGHNGDTLHLTITREAEGMGGSEFVIVTKQQGDVGAMWWGAVAN